MEQIMARDCDGVWEMFYTFVVIKTSKSDVKKEIHD
jgi:hypothetical protein